MQRDKQLDNDNEDDLLNFGQQRAMPPSKSVLVQRRKNDEEDLEEDPEEDLEDDSKLNNDDKDIIEKISQLTFWGHCDQICRPKNVLNNNFFRIVSSGF